MVLRQIGKGKEQLNGLINYRHCNDLKKEKNKKKVLLLLQSQVKKLQTSRRVLREQKKLYNVMSKMEHPGVNMSSSYIVSLTVDAKRNDFRNFQNFPCHLQRITSYVPWQIYRFDNNPIQ